MFTSIITTTHNRNESLKIHLSSITKQIVNFEYEILVLDDYFKKEQETVDIVNNFKYTRYIHTGKTKENKDFWRVPGFALNIGAKLAQGEILTITGCDIELLDVNGYQKIIDVISQKDCLVTINKVLGEKGYRPNRMPWFMTMKKQVFIHIGGYDEDFTGIAGEDNDIMDRLMSIRKLVTSNVNVRHHEHVCPSPEEIKSRRPHNVKLWKDRKNILVRNVNKDWGKL